MPTLSSRFQQSVMQLNRVFGSEIVERLGTQVTGTQMYMLHYILDSRKCRLTELAEKLDVKPSAVTVMIDRLQKAGYVTRSNDTADRRVIFVELTEDGRDILKKAQQIREDIVGSYLSHFGTEEARIATEVLEKIVKLAQQSPVK